eukprot:gene11292-11442_t
MNQGAVLVKQQQAESAQLRCRLQAAEIDAALAAVKGINGILTMASSPPNTGPVLLLRQPSLSTVLSLNAVLAKYASASGAASPTASLAAALTNGSASKGGIPAGALPLAAAAAALAGSALTPAKHTA